ncbi:hypothetical protein GCM10018952_73500 [Streptosporangium vulgare]
MRGKVGGGRSRGEIRGDRLRGRPEVTGRPEMSGAVGCGGTSVASVCGGTGWRGAVVPAAAGSYRPADGGTSTTMVSAGPGVDSRTARAWSMCEAATSTS